MSVTESKLLSDDALREIEARLKSWAAHEIPHTQYPASWSEVDALCATVRALSEKYEWLKSKTAWHRDGVGPDVPVMQERYDRLMAQRTALTTGLANIYHVITNEECDRAVALGMATSAVSSLLNQNTALREQLAQWEIRFESMLKRCRDEEDRLQSQLAQVTQERNDLFNRLEKLAEKL